jgi:hypothetical protein
MLEFNLGKWFHVTMEAISITTVSAAILKVVPALTAVIGLVYWSIMLYRLIKKKDK